MDDYQIKQEKEFAGKQVAPYFGAVLFGEALKVTNMLNLTSYNFLQGHLSDFALSAEITSVLLLRYGDSKLGRLVSVVAPATALTIHEFMQPIYKIPSPYTDSIDIACYFGGSIVAYLGVRAFGKKENREKIKNFVRNVNPFKRKVSQSKPLEDMIKSGTN